MSRPNLQEILDYCHEVDRALCRHLQQGLSVELLNIDQLAIQHEQQHQDLFLTDILYNLSQNPVSPIYLDKKTKHASLSIE